MLSHTTRTRNTLGGIAANASSQMQAQLQTLASEKDSAVALALALQQRITEVTALPETEDVRVNALRDADTSARAEARSQLPSDRVDALRDADSSARADARVNARAAATESADRIDSGLLHSVEFTTEQLDYAYANFERSPAAALSFLAANTGVANTPADLGPLIDGVPDIVTERCVADFMRATDLSLMHGCACCGMRTTDCVRIQRSELSPYAMNATETEYFDQSPI